MNDQTRVNGSPSGQLLSDQVELELRERLTVLEEWRFSVDATVGFLLVACVAFGIVLLLRKRVKAPSP